MSLVNQRFHPIKHVALDLDGTLYLGSHLFDATLPFLAVLKRLGIGRTFITNNSSRSTAEYVYKLKGLGIDASPGEIFSSTHSTLEYLATERPELRTIFVLGTPALREEFVNAGHPARGETAGDEPDAVVVGFDTTLSYDRLCRAAWWISRGKPFLATHPDRVCPTDQPTVLPDCGAICKLLSHATGREPDAILGKPSPRMVEGLLEKHRLGPHELAIVGDRLYTDIAMARSAGSIGVLVLSGETTAEQARGAEPQPDLVVADVGELGRLLQEAHLSVDDE